MPEYERSFSLQVSPDEAYGYLADPANMPRYVATMITARPGGEGRLRVAAEVSGRHEEGEASLLRDDGARRMEWGSGTNPRYHGWLEVGGSASSASVTIHISTDRTEEADEAERVLDQTVANIRAQLEPRAT
jgi:hypothetical protein